MIPSQNTKKIKRISIGLFIFTAFNALFVGLALIIRLANTWVINNFDNPTPDEIIFHLKVPLKGSSHELIIDFIKTCILFPLVVIIALLALYIIYRFLKYKRYMRTQNEAIYSRRFSASVHLLALVVAVTFCVFEANSFLNAFGFTAYLTSESSEAKFIDNHFVDPEKASLVFPEKKRNLLFIFLESMEATFASHELGGAMDTNLIPELTDLAMNNISFSNTDYPIGGSPEIMGTGWTIAGMISHEGGVPLKIPIFRNDLAYYSSVLPGLYTLGDVLKREGYNQTLLVGSDAGFGGRYIYYKQHGNFDIFDYNTAMDNGIIDDYVFWGFEDRILYEQAKRELLDLSGREEPFHLTMLTVDTHKPDGYVCELCLSEHDTPYWNVYSCASRQLDSFISWVQQQDFYADTSIVIVGDHTSMSSTVSDAIDDNYIRTRYNAFINSSVTTQNTKNRQYTPFDIYPTTLASMGVEIESDRLALGVNLFSDVPTLLETYGFDEVNAGLEGKSLKYMSFY